MGILRQRRTRARVAATWLLLLCLAALVFWPATTLAGGDKVQGDKGQGEVSRWAWLEEPWLQVVLGAVGVGAIAVLAILVARRRR